MIVLVHGAWHGSWCWEPLQRSLHAAGVTSLAVDLPGRGDDGTTAGELGIDDYADRLLEAIASVDEPIVLVGHSMGGVTISRAAERAPERFSSLIYLAALLLADGESGAEAFASDTDGELVRNVAASDDFTTTTVDPDAVSELFYGDCSPEDVEWARSRLVPEPLGVSMAPIAVTADRWGAIPRSYIICTEDRAISPTLQRAMAEQVGVDRIIELRASHSPFLSMPDALATTLIDLVS